MMSPGGSQRTSSIDRGSITGFVVVMTLAVIACAGLAVDGARIIGSTVRAADHAENAARAGAQELASAHSGLLALDPERARDSAQSYLASHGLTGVVTATAQRVTVTVTETVDMTLLSLIGVASRTVSATRSSAPLTQ